jgi:hypothetical protein
VAATQWRKNKRKAVLLLQPPWPVARYTGLCRSPHPSIFAGEQSYLELRRYSAS